MSIQSSDHLDPAHERLTFFSDAVFAIAITLLVIEIKVPHLESTDWREVPQALAASSHSLFGYVLSFLVIGRFWQGHHITMQLMNRHIRRITWPNLLMLLFIAFMPFATAFMSDNMANLGALLFYNLVLLAVALAYMWIVHIATDASHVRAGTSPEARATARARSHGVVATILLTLAITPFTGGLPGIGQLALAAMPLIQGLMVRRVATMPGADKEGAAA